jgi:erythromycin esterase
MSKAQKISIALWALLLAGVLPGGNRLGLAQEAPAAVEPMALEPDRPIEREMAAGEVHTYQVTLHEGEFLRAVADQRGIDVIVTVFSPNGQKIDEVDSPNGTNGPEIVEVAATTSGVYRLEVRPWVGEGAEPPQGGRYEARIDQLLSFEEYAEHLAAERARIEAVKQWLADHAIPLRTVEAGHGFEDMQPLREIVGDARVVALGEATHGTREFFQLKHRMLEFLVSEMGFTVFGIEATMPEAFDINEYVLTGEGDPAKALAGLYFWTWNTEEVLDMIEWMRRWNADPSHTRKVKFYGFDMQSAPRAVKVTLDYLRAVDTDEALASERQLAVLANPYTEARFVTLSKEDQGSAAAAIRTVLLRLDDHQREYIAWTDSMAWVLARQHARIVHQYIEMISQSAAPTGGFWVRDSAMAENIRWILEHEGPDAKMVVWAHNTHVSAAPNSMGSYLRKVLGPDMVVFGFAFNQGSFQAVERPFGFSSGIRPFTVEPAPEASLDAILAAAGLNIAAIDLRKLPTEGSLAEWWSLPRQTRSIGAGYGEQFASNILASQIVNQLYDGLLFVESTMSARPNPGGRGVGRAPLGAPVNLDFEEGDLGEVPAGWFPQSAGLARLRNFDFDVATSKDLPYRGDRSAVISRPPGRHYGETFGYLRQEIEAALYQGRRVRIRAAVRTDVTGQANQAHLSLRATKIPGAPSSGSNEIVSDLSITSDEWAEYEIVIDVPTDAEVIEYGLALVGDGRAWLDAVSIEVVDEE